jgi:hypothetical protein
MISLVVAWRGERSAGSQNKTIHSLIFIIDLWSLTPASNGEKANLFWRKLRIKKILIKFSISGQRLEVYSLHIFNVSWVFRCQEPVEVRQRAG